MALTAARLSAESVERIRAALIAQVLAEGDDHETKQRAEACGPWNLLVDPGCTWRTQKLLDPDLCTTLREHFGNSASREILLAAAGVKLSRTCLSNAQLNVLQGIAERHGFAVSASSESYIHRADVGKGGSANAIDRKANPGEEGGLRNVYIAADASLTDAGQMLEEAGDDEIFGTLLGIPWCCREAYMRLSPVASAKQNDFVMLALDNTQGSGPYNYWTNYPATYFGFGLISFFPCSFRCPNAASVAKSTFEMLCACDPSWANLFLKVQQTNILYTEYDGLHLFRRPLVDGCIQYGPGDFRSTAPTRVSEVIADGTRLEVRGKHEVNIYRDARHVASLDGEDIGLCAFL